LPSLLRSARISTKAACEKPMVGSDDVGQL
jgi:hypothetical protein